MARNWTSQDMLQIAGGFQPACVLIAAAELGLFDALAGHPLSAADLAAKLGTDPRATTILADALAALELLEKAGGRYTLAPGVAEGLTESGNARVLAMARHRGVCLRKWAQLARVTQTGLPAAAAPSVRGADADQKSFIEAMDEVSRVRAENLIASLNLSGFTHLLDLGGGPATWTIAFLKAHPLARATLFDLPHVIPLARQNVQKAGLASRVSLVAGNMLNDAVLPSGADLAWVSAIAHMFSREENVILFAKTHAALAPNGRVLIRDVVMDDSRTRSAEGAMFAVNMLVNTPGGMTYTFDEFAQILTAAGFRRPRLLREDPIMDSVIEAVKE